MATEIKMPQLSDTMSSGKILVWKKKEGEKVNRGDVLAEVETDKANLEIECFHPGVLIKVLIPEGSSAAVGEAIAYIGQAGENVASSSASSSKASAASNSIPAAESKSEVSAVNPLAKSSSHIGEDSQASERLKISPLARKIANESNLDVSNLRGSGPGGRIVKKDIHAAMTTSSSSPSSSTQPGAMTSSSPNSLSGSQTNSSQANSPQAKVIAFTSAPQPVEKLATASTTNSASLTPFSKMRETIARRMQESVTNSPHFYVTTSINMGEASKLRELLKEMPQYKGISVNHLVIKAAAYAICKEPAINCAVKDGQLLTPSSINIGIVTAIPDGLLIPVIKEADKLSLKDLVFEARSAVERAKAGRPNSSDLSGGTFSISNMGMFDVENFTAIISPGQGAILAISSTREMPIVENGQITIGKIMKVTLSSDHRIIDGIIAANFLKHLKQALEFPALIALE